MIARLAHIAAQMATVMTRPESVIRTAIARLALTAPQMGNATIRQVDQNRERQ
jgi:hypothetical protein